MRKFSYHQLKALEIVAKAREKRRRKMLHISPLSKEQAVKVLKALAYSFASGFVATIALQASDFIEAAQTGESAIVALGVALVVAAVVGGLNAVAVYIKQLFTEPK